MSFSHWYFPGCVGGVLAVANVLGQACCDLEALFKQGKMTEAKELQHRLIQPNINVSIVHTKNLVAVT